MSYVPPTPAEVRALLDAADLSIQETADALCVTRRQVHRYLAGERRMPWPSVYLLVQEASGRLTVMPDSWRERL